MPTFSDGTDHGRLSIDLSKQNVGTMRLQLQALLDDKEKQLQLAGTLGQRFLAQQNELEERINQLVEAENSIAGKQPGQMDEADSEMRKKLEELQDTLQQWENENQHMWSSLAYGAKLPNGNSIPPSPSGYPLPDASTFSAEDPSFNASGSENLSATQSNRRAKNAAHRQHDVEFAFEIGSSLINEVRRLQSLLGERDKVLQDMKEEKDDLEKTLESLRTTLRQQESSADKFKEENWNLEVTLQELRVQLTEAQESAKRAEGEQKRLMKQLASARETAETHKSESEKLTANLEELRAKHETDVAQMRKQAAGLQRDKSDLQSVLDGLKSDLAKQSRKGPRFGSPFTPNGNNDEQREEDDDDVFSANAGSRRKADVSIVLSPGDPHEWEYSPDPSPSKPGVIITPSHPSNEIEALKQALAHSQRQIGTLKNSIQREKELKIEYRRKLAQEGLASENWEDEDAEEGGADDSFASRGSTPLRGRGARGNRGRTPSKMSLAQKLGMGLAERGASGSPRTVEEIEEYEEGDQVGDMSFPSPSPFLDKPSRPTSVDGMDPAFANVLHTDQSPVARGAPRRSRGGAAFQTDARPPSIVDAVPTALAAELGHFNESDDLQSYTQVLPKVETAEIGIQYEPEEEVATPIVAPVVPPVVVPPIPVQTSEIGLQTEEPPVPAVVDTGVSTDVIVERDFAEMGIITDEEPSPKVPLITEIQTQTPRVQTMEMSVQAEPPVESMVIPSVATAIAIEDMTTSTIKPPSPQSQLRLSMFGRPLAPRPKGMVFDSDGEEKVETETENEYEDARESIAATTPTQSVLDFHSFASGTDQEFGVESDADEHSIKAPRSPSYTARRSRYDSRATYVAKPKPQVTEVSVQTDEWIPPVPPVPVLLPSPSPTRPGFRRVGSGASDFEYVPPAISAISSVPVPSGAPSKITRDSSGTFGGYQTPTIVVPADRADRRQSIESAFSGQADEPGRRSPRISGSAPLLPTVVDKTRPPTMRLPPPPSMPPPSIIPVKKGSIPPPRPTSPPPPELIQRATTPTFINGNLAVPHGYVRQHGSSMPPSQQGLRQPPSTSSFRSAAQAAARAGVREETDRRRDQLSSNASLMSGGSNAPSRRGSIASSHSSEHRPPQQSPNANFTRPQAPSTPGNAMMGSPMGGPGTTDPAIIHAITQTMIGEFLYKYTRRVVGKGHGEKRHKRFFWVHPYTKTLYWSNADPGASNATESNAKSAYIDAVRSVLDPNPLPPGIYQYSVVVSTPQREMKFTAPNKERHDIWFKALSYLLDRPSTVPMSSPGPGGAPVPDPHTPSRHHNNPHLTTPENTFRGVPRDFPTSPRSARSAGSSVDSWNLTPRAGSQSRQSTGKRAGTAAAEYLRTSYHPHEAQSPTKSIRSLQQRFDQAFGDDAADDNDYETVDAAVDFEVHDNDEAYEGLENVRACCDGAHDIASLSRKPGDPHHHHTHTHTHVGRSHTESEAHHHQPERPVSPSAWSFRSGRSRNGSTHSQEGSGGLFSKGLRFGSYRSNKGTPVNLPEQGRR